MRHLGLLLASLWWLVGCVPSASFSGGTPQLTERPVLTTTIAPTQDATTMPEQTDIADVVTPEVTAAPLPFGAFRLSEESNVENTPFTRRWTLFVQTPSNRYALSLECVPPGTADDEGQANYEELCRRTWEGMAAELEVMDFGLQTECPVVDPVPTTIEWRRVSSQWHQYSFEVSGSWLELRGPTPDRLGFLSDPALYNQLNTCPLPNGLMKLDFSADPPGNFGTGEPGSAPDLEGFTAITVAGHPAWMQAGQGEEIMGPSATGTSVYIQGPQFWYTIWLSCTPPTGAGTEAQAEFQEQCDSVLDHILQSFQILTAEATAQIVVVTSNPGEQKCERSESLRDA